MSCYVGIDLGGTNIRVGAVDKDGKMLECAQLPTERERPIEEIINQIVSMTEYLHDFIDCKAAGIGVCGAVSEDGTVLSSINLPGLNGVNLEMLLQDRLNMPCRTVNDANAAGLAEAVFGAGKKYRSIAYVTISTGIGGALIYDQKVIAGGHGEAGEFSNIKLGPGNAYFTAGGDCCGRKLVEFASQEMPDVTIKDAKTVFELAQKGRPKAIDAVNKLTYGLAQVFSTVSSVYDPDCFILGGGLMKHKDQFLPKVIRLYQETVFEEQKDTPFILAKMKEPGVIGAVAAAMKKLEEI